MRHKHLCFAHAGLVSSALLLAVTLFLTPSVVMAQSAPETYAAPSLVAGVHIRGNETTKEQFIQSQLKTRVDREFDSDVVQADVRRLAATGRFRDVRPYTQNTPNGVVVTFEVLERPTIRYIRYLGNRNISDKALSKQDSLDIGDPLNRFAVEEGCRKIEEFYHSKGFSKTQVTILEGDDESQDRGAVFLIDESALERISSVHFEGNTISSDARLKTLIKSKPGFMWYLFGGKISHKQIEQDVERLTAYYRGLGFFNARISRELEFNEKGDWTTITFVIDEGPRYVVRSVSVLGNKKFDSAELLTQTELKPGDYFNLGELNRDRNTLVDIYGGEGHIFADIQADPRFLEEPGQLDLVFNIEEGGVWRVGRINIHIKGEHPHTRESVVMNRISLRPGDIIDSRELRASERRLKHSQLFANDPSTGTSPEVVVRPPELQDPVENIAERNGPSSGSFRGQNPSGYR